MSEQYWQIFLCFMFKNKAQFTIFIKDCEIFNVDNVDEVPYKQTYKIKYRGTNVRSFTDFIISNSNYLTLNPTNQTLADFKISTYRNFIIIFNKLIMFKFESEIKIDIESITGYIPGQADNQQNKIIDTNVNKIIKNLDISNIELGYHAYNKASAKTTLTDCKYIEDELDELDDIVARNYGSWDYVTNTKAGGNKKSLKHYTVIQLKEKAKKHKIIGYSTMKKNELINAIHKKQNI